MTTSEQLFQKYCEIQGYSITAIPTESNIRRTADFRVNANGYEFIVEVKELTPNEEDIREFTEYRATGSFSGGGTVGERARSLIRSAADQLKSQKTNGLPGIIVLYDNIRIEGQRQGVPFTDLESWQIDAAMYGHLQVRYSITPSGLVQAAPDKAGPGRTTTRSEKLYVSAVCVLYDFTDLSMVTYHNYFAEVPFSNSIFCGPNDLHFKKPNDPEYCPGGWVRVQ